MSEETRITADPPSKTDTRICLLPKQEEPESSLLRRLWTKCRWHFEFLLLLTPIALVVWVQVSGREARIKFQQKQVEIDELRKKVEEMQKEHQQRMREAQRAQ